LETEADSNITILPFFLPDCPIFLHHEQGVGGSFDYFIDDPVTHNGIYLGSEVCVEARQDGAKNENKRAN